MAHWSPAASHWQSGVDHRRGSLLTGGLAVHMLTSLQAKGVILIEELV